MKAFIFILSLAIIGGQNVQWKKIEDLKQSFAEHYVSVEKIVRSNREKMSDTRLKAIQFIYELSDSYLLTTSNLNETDCYQSFFDVEGIQRSFQSEILRSQVPLENLLDEVKEKLDVINNTINMYQNLADSKHSLCKIMNTSCEEYTNLWLDGIKKRIRCEITPSCEDHVVSKRSMPNYCPADTFVCDYSKCLSTKYVCDGKSDCKDGTDEAVCCRNSFGRRLEQPSCTKGKCIERSKLCDGRDDCEDGSDEHQCGRIIDNCKIEYGRHLCDRTKCIGLDQVCDGTRDCNNGSDEGHLCGSGICPEECALKGGICYHGSEGPLCFAQCPLGTFESPAGCTAHPQPSNRTLVELLEDLPKLNYRQNGKLTYLKLKVRAAISNMMSEVFKCLDPNYPVLAKAVNYPVYSTTAGPK